ncbi:MAG: hypothetical protein WC142_03035 [Bacteroidales bacterium]|jgi:hypothetical protein|nr:hypothetical protein [Bacteroidales bacterium]MDD2688002.1 hypothetical protein [Bacteroidales bacterium]MDD3329821.1 hypothetical protein [Bacteroidales bacterium]MDD3691869.1 hypothetical protein [Bacteroidales bacterium]MDD4043937.1 hypothetical protein [Bacteroidales bacterium]
MKQLKSKLFRKANKGSTKSADIYAKSSNGTIISPFGFKIDPMEQLILVNFEKDPDKLYNILEFQKASDKNGNKYLLAIAYRIDGKTDVFYQEGFPFGAQESILNNVSFYERPLENAKFEINSDHIMVYFDFEDTMGREIKVQVNESKTQKKKPFFLLAPVGANSKTPMSLPVYSLYEMSFTKQKFSDILIEIDNVKHKPDTFPIPIECSKNYLTRYTADTFNVDWNTNYNGKLYPLIPNINNVITDKGINYELENIKGHYEIKSIHTSNHKHKISINFYPSIPDIICLRQGIGVDGNFSITTDNAKGNLNGYYRIKNQENEIHFEINPAKGWKPNEKRWILKIIFYFIKVFKEWPKTYIWNAKISLNDTAYPIMYSGWKRI